MITRNLNRKSNFLSIIEPYPIRWNFRDMAYGPDPNQKIDVKIPKKKDVHAIIYIHGGAYLVGNKFEYPSFLADYSENNLIASIDYRLINENNQLSMQDILIDINSAIMKIIELSNSYNCVIKDFLLIGHSAGGHIALLYGYKNMQKEIKITACISLAGPTDFTDDSAWSSMTMWGENLETRLSFLSQLGSRLTGHLIELTQSDWTNQKDFPAVRKYVTDISPITYVSQNSKIPPTLLIHARNDDQVPYSNSVRLKSALHRYSIPGKLITPSGNADSHMLGGTILTENSPIYFGDQKWVKEAKKWMEKYL